MFDKKIDPNKDPRRLTKKLNDSDINFFKEQLNSLKELDFPVITEIDNVKSLLNPEEVDYLKIVKLTYCLGLNKQTFLCMGIILESILNNIAELYISKGWKLPNYTATSEGQSKYLNKFISKYSIGEKGEAILSMNIFNNTSASKMIANKIAILSVLRNYGGHSNVNSFLKKIESDASLVNTEIRDCMNLIKIIHKAKDELINNPP